MKKNLYLFFPMKEVGGVQILFLRLSEYLVEQSDYNIFVIDYKDGYIAKNYNKDKIKLIEYSQNKNIFFNNNDCVLFQSMPLNLIPSNLKFSQKTKLLYWNLHPLNFGSFTQSIRNRIKNNFFSNIFINIYKTFINPNQIKTIKIFDKYKAICFMDGANIKSVESNFKYILNSKILIPLLINDIQKLKFVENDKTINALWLGRICDFKVHILLHTIETLSRVKPNASFTVIGDGDYLDYLKKEVRNIKNMQIIFKDYISPKDLKEIIINYNLGFSMGTSSLDMAKYGLPTICLDGFYEKLQKFYNFKWLYTREDYTLGEILNSDYGTTKENNTLSKCLDECIDNFDKVSNNSFEYIQSNFNPRNTSDKLLQFIDNATLYYENIPKDYFEFNWYQRIRNTRKAYGEYQE